MRRRSYSYTWPCPPQPLPSRNLWQMTPNRPSNDDERGVRKGKEGTWTIFLQKALQTLLQSAWDGFWFSMNCHVFLGQILFELDFKWERYHLAKLILFAVICSCIIMLTVTNTFFPKYFPNMCAVFPRKSISKWPPAPCRAVSFWGKRHDWQCPLSLSFRRPLSWESKAR